MPTVIHLPQYAKMEIYNHGSWLNEFINGNDLPKSEVIHTCQVQVAPGVQLQGYAWGDHIFVESDLKHRYFSPYATNARQEQDDDQTPNKPFFRAEVVGVIPTPMITYDRGIGFYGRREQITRPDFYTLNTNNYKAKDADMIPYTYLRLRIIAEGADPVEGDFRFYLPETGKAVLDQEFTDKSNYLDSFTVTVDFYGRTHQWRGSLKRDYTQSTKTGLRALYTHLKGSTLPDGSDAWWERFFEVNPECVLFGQDTTGLTSIFKKKEIAPTIARLQKEYPLDWKFFQWLQSSTTWNKQKNNSLLSAFLMKVGADFEATLGALRKARNVTALTTSPSYGYDYEFDRDTSGYTYGNLKSWASGRRAICLSLPGAVEKAEAEEEKSDWRKRKTNAGQADGLGITSDFPLLRKAVEEGKIPTSIFHQPKGDAVNIEFDLWERALKQKGWAEVIFSITQTASRRSTYEKDISPYLAFLFRIPKYLEKHTGKKWKVMPKFVESEWDLEMKESEENQDAKTTVKRRSAFTPVADNETHTLTVPYVAVSVSGVRTQWCYSRFYYLFEEGFTDPESGGIVTKDFEPKLNGRDDYGLMYYTLTGTDTARGYPTFLIIFERLENQTRVHFHRVRPQRIKDGKQTPACKLIEACYQYMAGNIPASDITAQQGDLIFIKHPNDPLKAGAKTADPQEGTSLDFESHRMESLSEHVALKLFESKAKTPANRLGFLFAPTGFRVNHPEHQDIPFLGEGWYEVRRCRSFEASPKGIWSLTID